ncbi:MAG: bifunctional N(6)-L-threonylcarbamoyladenine synthase/serine/threonine protein kinase [Candidatus Diapherotrites archaeon]|nr:bifunctional N(6)-L-threonylcarbamoyladenine synthase/serine/threonine protein kinase [Candidatus Diapherotrites archaeon]
MICLGIESTAHTFGVGITDGRKCLANRKLMYRAKGGIHPREAAQYMTDNAHLVLKEAIEEADISMDDIGLFAFAQGPGLGPCLRVGAAIARVLSLRYKKPIVGVNHCIAHVEVGKWDGKLKDPLVVYVSGANTQILGLAKKRYRIYGETLDIGLGNAIDVFAREFGVPMPGGPWLEKTAKKGKRYIELPYTVKGMDLAFSGLLTAAKKLARKKNRYDLCYSFQETLFGMLVEVSERALAHTKKREVLLVGGVAQNKRLNNMFNEMCRFHNAKFFVSKPEYNADNGFMIALTGLKMFKAGVRQKDLHINQKWRTDEVEVIW